MPQTSFVAFLAACSSLINCCMAVQVANDSSTQQTRSADTARISKTDDRMYSISFGDSLFAQFNGRDFAKPIFYPLVTSDNVQLTRNFPMKDDVAGEAHDHPHHKSMWLAHGDVDGFDFWSEKASIVCKSVTIEESSLLVVNHWIADDDIRVVEETRYSFLQKDACRYIDVDAKFKPGEKFETVTFGDTKEGFFAVRSHPNLRLTNDEKAGVRSANGQALNSAGDKDKDVWGKEATWVYYWGDIEGKTYGIGMFNHADNSRHPTTWHARDYGLIAANPFGLHDFLGKPKGSGDHSIDSDHPLRLRYRLAISNGQLTKTSLEAIAADFDGQNE